MFIASWFDCCLVVAIVVVFGLAFCFAWVYLVAVFYCFGYCWFIGTYAGLVVFTASFSVPVAVVGFGCIVNLRDVCCDTCWVI